MLRIRETCGAGHLGHRGRSCREHVPSPIDGRTADLLSQAASDGRTEPPLEGAARNRHRADHILDSDRREGPVTDEAESGRNLRVIDHQNVGRLSRDDPQRRKHVAAVGAVPIPSATDPEGRPPRSRPDPLAWPRSSGGAVRSRRASHHRPRRPPPRRPALGVPPDGRPRGDDTPRCRWARERPPASAGRRAMAALGGPGATADLSNPRGSGHSPGSTRGHGRRSPTLGGSLPRAEPSTRGWHDQGSRSVSDRARAGCAAARRPIMPLSTFTRGVGGSASTPETFTSGRPRSSRASASVLLKSARSCRPDSGGRPSTARALGGTVVKTQSGLTSP